MLVELCVRNENGCSTRIVSVEEPIDSNKIQKEFDEWMGDSTNVANMSWSQVDEEDQNLYMVGD